MKIVLTYLTIAVLTIVMFITAIYMIPYRHLMTATILIVAFAIGYIKMVDPSLPLGATSSFLFLALVTSVVVVTLTHFLPYLVLAMVAAYTMLPLYLKRKENDAPFSLEASLTFVLGRTIGVPLLLIIGPICLMPSSSKYH